MKWHYLLFMGITSTFAFLPGCSCDDGRQPINTPDQRIPLIEGEFVRLQKEIKETQEKVRTLLTKMVTEIEEGDIDASRAAADVEQTTEEIKRLKARIQKLRGVKPESVPRPIT